MGKLLDSWKASALKLSRQVKVIFMAYQDPRVPVFNKLLIGLVIGYALSPIDLIPDFIPVLGLLDDLLLLPLGVYWCLKMIPKEVILEAEQKADQITVKKSLLSAVGIILIWILTISWILWKIFRK